MMLKKEQAAGGTAAIANETKGYKEATGASIVPHSVHCDGLTEPRNPGGWGCWGWIAFDANGNELASDRGCIGVGPGITNNKSEYAALIEALTYAIKQGWHDFTIYMDSQLAVNQVTGQWQCRSPYLQPLCEQAQQLIAQTGAMLRWVPREQNEPADALSRRAYAEARRRHTRRQEVERWHI